MLLGTSLRPLSHCRLYAFVDSGYLNGRGPTELAKAMCDGGADLIQVRAKDWPEARVRQVVRELLPITNSAGVGLVVNDFLAVAQETGAPICHLGQEDFFEAGHGHVRELPGYGEGQVKIGLSTHNPAQAERALRAGADYVAVGPVYATGTKPTAKPVTLDYVRWAALNIKIPWFAIGGITLQNLDDVLAAGARGICVVSAILNAPDVRRACEDFRKRIDQQK